MPSLKQDPNINEHAPDGIRKCKYSDIMITEKLN
jgi:hypothetical protein